MHEGLPRLRQNAGNFTITDSGLAGISFSLLNGDVDGDNEVGIGDYSQLSNAYNSFEGDPNWDAEADLTGDGGVDIGDYAVLSGNYGAFGD